MIPPPLEVADIIRIHGSAFVERHHRWLTVLHRKVLRAIAACRTAALGGHIEQCDNCGQRAISYNSCLNRHCPKCQAAARQRWLEKRSAELLPVPYYHVVFTLPHVLAPLALQNKALVYGLLFRATAETLLQSAADPKHLGAEIGFLAVLHTWGKRCSLIPISIAWSQGEGSPQITGDGLHAETSSFSPSKYSVWSFAGSFLTLCNAPFKNVSLLSPANWPLCNPLRRLPLCCARQPSPIGSFMRSDPLLGQRKSSPISRAIRTALPSPTPDSFRSRRTKSASYGETMPTDIGRAP